MLLVGADEYALAPRLTPIGQDFGIVPARAQARLAAKPDRVHRRTVGLVIAPNFAMAVGARIVTGAAAASLAPNAFAVVGDFTDDENRSSAMGYVQSGLTLGLILSPGVGGWAAGSIGWRSVFVVIAMLAVVATISLALLPSKKSGTRAQSADEQAVIIATLRRPGALAAHAAMFLWLASRSARSDSPGRSYATDTALRRASSPSRSLRSGF